MYNPDSDREEVCLGMRPIGEMAVVADTDDCDEGMPESMAAPRSVPLVPHIRVVTRFSAR